MPMDVAAFQATLDYLRLTHDAAAALLGVHLRTVRHWAAGTRPIPESLTAELRELERHALQAENDMRNEALSAGRIPVYRSDADLWEAEPWHRPWPARWHRALAGGIAAESQSIRILYPPSEEGR